MNEVSLIDGHIDDPAEEKSSAPLSLGKLVKYENDLYTTYDILPRKSKRSKTGTPEYRLKKTT